MTEEQRFAFDTWGFFTVEDAITPEQVAELKANADEKGSPSINRSSSPLQHIDEVSSNGISPGWVLEIW